MCVSDIFGITIAMLLGLIGGAIPAASAIQSNIVDELKKI
jgi:ABC-type antimicrobial peptide transport system permease subunit